MDHQIQELLRNLVKLGYNSTQVRNIIQAALGDRDIADVSHAERHRLVNTLEEYVRLGQEFVLSYSK
ncbi:MAG TPA: hypothetical protein DCP36_06425 [Sporomusaceae bacterium]|jgi:hypothetical protein|uniref:hypothetical protein n=1 Tax=Anaerospora sp. TaxID=1960278 RepID=UPI000EDB4995|nr:hypothetical protein [Anaerospora sp.]MDF2930622.1 hypothetical protein [Anaerospora sp.]HAK73312.1 hypothetical protein [Sporomusaceae bacterium]